MKRMSALIMVGLSLLLGACATTNERDYTTRWAPSAPEFMHYTEPFLRAAVSEFITKLDLRDVTLVGESIGGVLALTVSVDQPDRVKRVASLNPYDYGESFGGGIRRSRSGWMVGMFNVLGSYTFEPRFVTASVLHGGFHDAARLPEALLDELSRTGSRDGYRSVEYSVFRNWTTWLGSPAPFEGEGAGDVHLRPRRLVAAARARAQSRCDSGRRVVHHRPGRALHVAREARRGGRTHLEPARQPVRR
jgi:pimeloyl-ACP methyl ester carboxylesterase